MGLKKKIFQFKDGVQVGVYDSATEAAEAVGSTKSNVSKCCCGKLKQVNGFTFAYTGEFTNQHKEGDVCCPYCDRKFVSYNGLAKHVIKYKEHGDVSKERLLADYKYGGVRPTCKCGCGELTEISYDGGPHFCDYVRGHHSRVHNNWGHNEEAKRKSAETRRQQYASGERIQWNKGKSWNETYTDEEIETLMSVYDDKERNGKISAALKGVKKSEEHAEKCRENGRSEKSIEVNRKKMREMLLSGKFSLSSEIEKKFIAECVDPLGIEYDTQYYLKDIHHYCDAFIPEKNTIIEFQGDYWHGNPKKYTKEELSPYQLKKVEKDEILRKYCSDNGIQLIEVWESDFNKDPAGIKTMVHDIILL